jgi:hypothetical protein
MPAPLSNDLRWRIVYLLINGHKPTEIAFLLHVGESTVKRIRETYAKWADIRHPFNAPPGRHKVFSRDNLKVFLYFVNLWDMFI